MPVVITTDNNVLVRTRNGRDFRFQAPFRFRNEYGSLFQVPSGSWTDGCSTPQAGWSAGVTPFGPCWLGGAGHDAAYRDNLQRLRPGCDYSKVLQADAMRKTAMEMLQHADAIEADCWQPASLTKDQSDTLFLDLMVATGVDEKLRTLYYEGVHLFGWRAFREDRAAVATDGQQS